MKRSKKVKWESAMQGTGRRTFRPRSQSGKCGLDPFSLPLRLHQAQEPGNALGYSWGPGNWLLGWNILSFCHFFFFLMMPVLNKVEMLPGDPGSPDGQMPNSLSFPSLSPHKCRISLIFPTPRQGKLSPSYSTRGRNSKHWWSLQTTLSCLCGHSASGTCVAGYCPALSRLCLHLPGSGGIQHPGHLPETFLVFV